MVRLVLLVATVLVLPLAGLAPVAAQEATPTAEAGPAWLFVQAFDAATLTPHPDAGARYTLTLTGVDEALLAFTDRPDRQVAHVATARFAAGVSAQQGSPLNATLVAPLADGTAAMVVVELLGAAHDAAAGTVTYQVVVLGEETGDLRVAATPLAAPEAAQTFGAGHLFVDDWTCYIMPLTPECL